MRLSQLVAVDASPCARRIAAEQARALEALGARVQVHDIEGGVPPGRLDGDVLHLHPGPGTDLETGDALGVHRPLFLHLWDPAGVGAELADTALRVIVPSRSALVHLAGRVQLRPRQACILAPGTSIPRVAAADPRPAGEPLRLLHLGPRDDQPGLLELVSILGEFEAGSVELRAVGAAGPGTDEALRGAAGGLELALEPAWDWDLTPAPARGADLAVFPYTGRESYALAVDDALAMGLPVWVAGAEVVGERYDASAYTRLPRNSPGAWRSQLRAWLADPDLARVAQEHLPEHVPSTGEAAEALLRWSREAYADLDSRTRIHRRPA
jgi:hypothetical protein